MNLIYFDNIYITLASSDLISSDGPYFSESDVTETAFFNAYLNLTAAQLINIAHQPKSMIRHCHILGENANTKCNQLMEGAIKIFTPKYGVCYKFNSVHKDRLNESLTVDNTGPDNGLHLQIDVQGLKI